MAWSFEPQIEKLWKWPWIKFLFTDYEKVRARYHATTAFPHLYDKIKPEIDVVQVGKDFMDPLWYEDNYLLKIQGL